MTKGANINILQLFIDGGWPMYPIVLLSIVAITITIERILVVWLQSSKLNPEKFAELFDATLKKYNFDKMQTADEMLSYVKDKKRSGVGAEIMIDTLLKFKDGMAKRMNPIEIKQWMRGAAEAKANTELVNLEKHLSALAVISNVATLMGLFGTVIGMIDAFYTMSQAAGGVKADQMARGIAVALVCTAGGLTVAIPSLILYNWIKGVIEGFVVRIEETVTGVIDVLAE
jgi:biopolymer transport protein ExbB